MRISQGGGVGRGVGRAVALVDLVLVGAGVAVGAGAACKILLRRSSVAGGRAAFPRSSGREASAGADAPLITDVPINCWPNQTRRPIIKIGIVIFGVVVVTTPLREL